MKKDIHPKVHTNCVVTCACGNTFKTISTLPSIAVDICSACHPLFTGQQKLIDTEGRIDKFQKRMKKAQPKKEKKVDVNARLTAQPQKKHPTLREMLEQAREK
jgi:large subunit ribosomal protein L31